MKKVIVISFLSFISTIMLAQSSPREENKFGINAILFGPTLFVSASLDYFITPSVCAEVGGGAIGYYGGLKYHFGGDSDKNWTPYLGGYFTYTVVPGFIKDDIKANAIYIPVGFQYMANKGFTMSFEAAGFVSDKFKKDITPWIGIKIGKHF
jgi:hypothetical protein